MNSKNQISRNNNNNNVNNNNTNSAALNKVRDFASSSCPICLELLKYPVTLSCGHTVSKPCVLGASVGGKGINIRCPICRKVSFYNSEADLIVNKELQSQVEILRGTAVMQQEADQVKKPPFCRVPGHESYRLDLYDMDQQQMICVLCAQTMPQHRGHQIVPLRQAAQIEAVKLRPMLESAHNFRADLRRASQHLEDLLDECERSSGNQTDEFNQQVDLLIEHINRRRHILIREAKQQAADQQLKIRRSKDQILHLASKLNETMALCQRAISHLSDVDVIQGRAEMEKQLSSQPPVVLPNIRLPRLSTTLTNNSTEGAGGSSLHELFAAVDASMSLSSELPNAPLPPASVLEASSIFSGVRGFKFGKSTYNDVIVTNRGHTVMAPPAAEGWETVMADQLLSVGTHYWEVKLDQYANVNGHNVCIGVVFDGGFELCEILGEDVNSAGLNCGRGTKCVGGTYLEPYADPCQEGDVIGVKVDYVKEEIEFFRNGASLGVAFSGVCRPAYAAVSLVGGQQVSVMFPQRLPVG